MALVEKKKERPPACEKCGCTRTMWSGYERYGGKRIYVCPEPKCKKKGWIPMEASSDAELESRASEGVLVKTIRACRLAMGQKEPGEDPEVSRWRKVYGEDPLKFVKMVAAFEQEQNEMEAKKAEGGVKAEPCQQTGRLTDVLDGLFHAVGGAA